jgi:Amt family ammonium transporter
VIGIGAGIVYVIGSKCMLYWRIDDAVDAVAVHMFGGAWGDIATGLFSRRDLLNRGYLIPNNIHQGWFFSWGEGSGDAHLLACQIVGVIFIFFWVFTMMFILFSILKALGLYRVDPIEEEVGLDISRHHGPAYDTHTSVSPDAVEELNKSRSKSGYSSKPYDDTEKEVETAVPPSAVAEEEA